MIFGSDRHPASLTLAGVGTTLLAAYILGNLFGPVAERSISATAMHVAALVVLIATAALRRPVPGQATRESIGDDPLLPTVRRLASAIDAADPFTRGRAYRVSRYAAATAERLDIAPDTAREIELAALLHNIGRVAIHRDVLLKSGRLTDDERREIQTHPQLAHAILRDIPALTPAAELVLCCQERPDGKGYPRGLGEREIPLGSQIIKVASAFDAMTSDRPYRTGLPPEKALEELRAGAGSEFGSRAVACFVELFESGALFRRIDRDELRLYGDETGVLEALEELERSTAAARDGEAARAA